MTLRQGAGEVLFSMPPWWRGGGRRFVTRSRLRVSEAFVHRGRQHSSGVSAIAQQM